MIARDPITGAKITWTSHPQWNGYALPISQCVLPNSVGRRWAVPEHPDCASLFDGKICVACAGWDALAMQMYRFNPVTLAYVDEMQSGQFNTGTSYVEDRQIPTAHRISQIAAATNNLFWICNTGTQGAQATYATRRLAAGSNSWVATGNFALTNAAHWTTGVVPTVGGSALTSSYYYGCRALRMGAGVERVLIPGLWNTADAKSHAGIAYSDDLYTKAATQVGTWTFRPTLTQAGAQAVVMAHVGSWSAPDGSASMLVGVVSRLYCMDYINIVYSDDGGATWMLAGVNQADVAIPAAGLANNDAAVLARQPFADANKTFSVQRVFYDPITECAWVSFLVATGRGFLNAYPDGVDAACYLLKINMINRGAGGCVQTVYGPFLASPLRNFGNGIQIMVADDPTRAYGVVAMPVARNNLPIGYLDQPDGGPTLNVYSIPLYTTVNDFNTWTLVRTISLPAGGSPYGYAAPVVENIIHEWGYGNGQLFNGIVPVEGTTNKVAVILGDQRITGVHQCFHMGRLAVKEIA